jgi:hypothetical protein
VVIDAGEHAGGEDVSVQTTRRGVLSSLASSLVDENKNGTYHHPLLLRTMGLHHSHRQRRQDLREHGYSG